MRTEKCSEENVAYVVQLCKELHGAGTFGIHGPDFEWDYTLAKMRYLMGRDDYYIHLAYDDNASPCGFVGGHMETFFFNPMQYGAEDAWFVRDGTPGRTKIAVKLMRGFISWVMDENKGRQIVSGDIASINPLAVDGLYKHLGFRRYGTLYKYAREA